MAQALKPSPSFPSSPWSPPLWLGGSSSPLLLTISLLQGFWSAVLGGPDQRAAWPEGLIAFHNDSFVLPQPCCQAICWLCLWRQ